MKCSALSPALCLMRPVSCQAVRKSKRARGYCRKRSKSRTKAHVAIRTLQRAHRRAVSRRDYEAFSSNKSYSPFRPR